MTSPAQRRRAAHNTALGHRDRAADSLMLRLLTPAAPGELLSAEDYAELDRRRRRWRAQGLGYWAYTPPPGGGGA